MTTKGNLKKALAGESTAYQKYIAFAKRAEEEGYNEAAELFRQIAEEEKHHVSEEIELLGIVKKTKANIKNAIKGEEKEAAKMYPEFAKKAEEEGNKAVADRFKEIAEDEKIHAEKFRELLINLRKKK